MRRRRAFRVAPVLTLFHVLRSPSFQRFAIRTDAMLAEKRKQVGDQVPQHLDEALSKSKVAAEAAAAQSQTFVQAFVTELTKGFRTGGGGRS